MDVFELRQRLVDDYGDYTKSFIKISDPRIQAKVDEALTAGALWPEPLLQLNPTFKPGGTIDELVAEGILHSECARIFRIDKSDTDWTGRQLLLHAHQRDAIRIAKAEKSYVLTSGTGSGKSLTYIVPIVDHVLRRGSGRGIQAIVVYPMNALANSQNEELGKFLLRGYPEGKAPVRFARYTGQEGKEAREAIRQDPPDILLTNYMMLELLLTRYEDRALVRAANGLRFLVFDELHTYRGRQGADVALLIRRCRLTFQADREIICVGTSATMAAGGTFEEQRQEVAEVANTLFGAPVEPDQVVGETLERATPETDAARPETASALATIISSPAPPPEDWESFRDNPLASWIESAFGIGSEPESGRLVRRPPRPLRGPTGAARELAELTGTGEDDCVKVLRAYLLKGSELRRSAASRYPVFAFRLHQFFTRGDTVWCTLESEGVRHLELSKLGSKPGDEDKPLFPLVFCRSCGAPYYRVSAAETSKTPRYLPREDGGSAPGGDVRPAYLYLDSLRPWPASDDPGLLDRLPAHFKEPTAEEGERILPDKRKDLPKRVWVNPKGDEVEEGEGILVAEIGGNFHFCLNPDCRIAYVKNQKSERAKLATLGVDNRSTATTILAVRSLIELQNDTLLTPDARKLLSFTDNRQDASLQAGHFNDFAQVSLLRSALHRAAASAGDQGLRHAQLAGAVYEAINLKFEDFAADPDLRGPARQQTREALERVITYHLYRDLQRDWRVNAPNLEDCGLLTFDYDGLRGPEGLLSDPKLWVEGLVERRDRNAQRLVETPALLRNSGPRQREEVLCTLLDVLRRGLAVKVDVLDSTKQRELVESTNARLLEGTVWYLEDTRDLEKATVVYPCKRSKFDFTGLFLNSYHAFGRYLKRALQGCAVDPKDLRREAVDEVIRFLLEALRLYGILEHVRTKDEIPGYQINHAALRWIAGTGETRPVDRTRMLDAGELAPEVNAYFVECYKHFVDLKCLLEAREHTAQVAPEDRQEREDRFRKAELPLLFCSPTMELGVDIAQLNVVNLRNVPPTPANYAQRSGRAGRGGQPALVYTYCAGRSPHDQYYFREPEQMVSGAVAAPRIDLRNRDLFRSHLHAIWMEEALPDLGKTLTMVLDLEPAGGRIPLPVKRHLRELLESPLHRAAALHKAERLIAGLSHVLAGAPWFHPNWAREVMDKLFPSFDRACDRWRELYRSALRQRSLHHNIVLDFSRPQHERDHSQRLRAQAESQIRLLTEAEGIYEGDFYSYRYFASEGFLPGYNFPRLPLSAFVPARRRRKGRDEFISRPRFLAISEFGPQALLYHEGARYKVNKVNLDFGSDDIEAAHELHTDTMKRCPDCGYAHLERGVVLTEICERCGRALDADAAIRDLVLMQNVTLKMVKRITCDEEERQRYGYKLVTAYSFPQIDGRQDRRDAEVLVGDQVVMRLAYGDATTLYRINLGWAHQKSTEAPGFTLDLERGYWAAHPNEKDDDQDVLSPRRKRVVPYVLDTKNALAVRFEPPRSEEEMAGLQAAFKEAIQKHYQLEPRELAAEALPLPFNRKEILFYEAAEGGAGVLRQLVEDPQAVSRLARTALEICHFDPVTLEDLKADSCGKACYSCLLDYANQWDHRHLDRLRIREILGGLRDAVGRPAGGAGSRSGRMEALRRQCDSELEKRWLDHLDRLLLAPPSHAQFLMEEASTRPDFFYDQHNAAVYIDGPPHDEPEQAAKDEAINSRLMHQGVVVIRFHHAADWDAIFRKHPDIFGEPQK